MSRRRGGALTLLLLVLVGAAVAAETEQTGLGSEPTAAELGAAGYTVFPDGKGLPEGRGTVSEGRAVYSSSVPPATAATPRARTRRPWSAAATA